MTEKIREGMAQLTGRDVLEVEAEERATGNNLADLTLSKKFQARLAARALQMNVHDLRELPMRKYNQACVAVVAEMFAPAPIDIVKLQEKLDAMTGYDLEVVEAEERLAGNKQPELSMSKKFQARLAARALGMKVDDLLAKPVPDFIQACAVVFSFLFESESEVATR